MNTRQLFPSFFSRSLVMLSCTLGASFVYAQESDSIRQLSEVTIQAYAHQRPLWEAPAAISLVDQALFNRVAPVSLLPALNSVSGVRMEERSPGSYRLAIRGSSLRSPFGVRNVKIYWNGLPFTDGGGNTYLNLVDIETLQQAQIIKGPGSSLYGAGTGGVVLLDDVIPARTDYQLSLVAGSYGLWRFRGDLPVSIGKTSVAMGVSYQQSEGYRDHTAFDRWQINARSITPLSDRSTLSLTMFHTQLEYETPGGLTRAQYDENPRQARPATNTFPGAEMQQAGVANTTTLIGARYVQDWNHRWSTQISALTSFTDFTNAAIRNFEVRHEQNIGMRMENSYSFGRQKQSQWVWGVEWQRFHSGIDEFENNSGAKGAVRLTDQLKAGNTLAFTQTSFDLPAGFQATLGASIQWIRYSFDRTFPEAEKQKQLLAPVASPRIALGKKFHSSWQTFINWSYGFSPPTLAEVRPSTGVFNDSLASETGSQWEAGIRYQSKDKRWMGELTGYRLALREAIVIQRDASGADFFTNTGGARQPGLEGSFTWHPVQQAAKNISDVQVRATYAYQPYRFDAYVNLNGDFSNKALTGVPENNLLLLADMEIRQKWLLQNTVQYTDRIPLNDANTEFSDAFWIMNIKLTYRWTKSKTGVDFFAGVDNLTNRHYSLGDDINAAGGRYYNLAPGRMWYGGAKFRWK
jgi:iron complex outermembrane receptor protein